MIDFFHMSDKDMILLPAAISVLLIEGLNAEQQATLGNFIMSVGQNVVSAAVQRALCEEKLKEPEE